MRREIKSSTLPYGSGGALTRQPDQFWTQMGLMNSAVHRSASTWIPGLPAVFYWAASPLWIEVLQAECQAPRAAAD